MAEIEYEYGILELMAGVGWELVTGRPFTTSADAEQFLSYLQGEDPNKHDPQTARKLEIRKRAVGGWEPT